MGMRFPLSADDWERMPEKEFQARVMGVCEILGLPFLHASSYRKLGYLRGWPDLMVIGTRIIFAELKAQRGEVKDHQLRVRKILDDAGGEWYLWRPRDLKSGKILEVLTSLTPGTRAT